jgi:hypothetical protein
MTVDYMQTHNVGEFSGFEALQRHSKYQEILKGAREGCSITNSGLSSIQSPFSQTHQIFFMQNRMNKQGAADHSASISNGPPHYLQNKF